MINNDCSTCASCKDVLSELDTKLISIADKSLYNARYELNREVDYDLYKLIMFYKKVGTDICNDNNCNFCYGYNTDEVIEKIKILSV